MNLQEYIAQAHIITFFYHLWELSFIYLYEPHSWLFYYTLCSKLLSVIYFFSEIGFSIVRFVDDITMTLVSIYKIHSCSSCSRWYLLLFYFRVSLPILAILSLLSMGILISYHYAKILVINKVKEYVLIVAKHRYSRDLYPQLQMCVICQEPFQEQEHIARTCYTHNHYYHLYCIRKWIRSNSRIRCPLCNS